MAEVRPFRGLRYNQKLVRSFGEVVCPPYDVISPEYQRVLYDRSPYNVVRLEHGLILPGDDMKNNRHARAAAIFSDWRVTGIFQFDAVPSIYVHDHFFNRDVELRRRGFMARVRLEPDERRTVLPHENTVPGIKSDRLMLMRACWANISPIFILYHDSSGEIASILEQAAKSNSIADFAVPEGERHRLWLMDDTVKMDRLIHLLSSQTLYIADGHHRYETSVAYLQERRSQAVTYTGDEGFNFIMATLVAFDDPGLIIYPIHRMIHGLTSKAIERLRERFEAVFDVNYIANEKARDGVRLLREMNGLFVIIGLKPDKAGVCCHSTDSHVDKMMPLDRSPAYKCLPVSLLHHLVLDRLSEYSDKEGYITYTHDEAEAWEATQNGKCQMAVILPPTSPSTIREIADAGDRMPGKSTFFNPKLPTGLVLNYLEI